MAPSFCGAHYSVICHDCSFPFPCDAEHLPTDGRAACPNCGYTDNALDDAQFTPPDQVLIDRWPLLRSSPRRGDIVAIAVPGSSDMAVKRLAGLPGERLSIAAGDLFANDNILRKTVAELRQLRLHVHDNDFQPRQTANLPPRWRPAQTQSRWKETNTGFGIDPHGDSNDYDWLQYEHWKGTADAKARGIAAAITDNDSYNQGETRRSLNVVNDVFLSCRLQASGTGKLALAAVAGDQRFELEIEPRRKVVLRMADQLLAEKQLTIDFSHRFVRLEFGLCDQQVLLVIDGRTVLRHAYASSANSKFEPVHPIAIGAQNIHLQLTKLCIWRDIYYLDPQGLSRPWQMPQALNKSEYALLGDNQPVSIDSRHWEAPGMPHAALLGRVYHPFWASRRLD
jgi:signal peptidase I